MRSASPRRSGPVDGPTLFARYAYPPNERGFCGPADHRAMLEYGAAGVVDAGLRHLARGFNGAWPYLALIAQATGIGDPLDRRVVEGYWLGTAVLDTIDMGTWGNALRERFHRRVGSGWASLSETVPAGAVPSHSFHVFEVYPWTGLLDSYRGGHPLHILDRCRIRWGQVIGVDGDEAVVRSAPLTWNDGRLSLGAPQVETARCALDGNGFVQALRAGEWVSLHWSWICDRLSAHQLVSLRGSTARQLSITNRRVGRPGVAMALS